MVLEERRDDVAKIPRPYLISIVGIIVVLLSSLIGTIYSTGTSTAATDIRRQETEISSLRDKNDNQDTIISKLLESNAALTATVNTVLPQINARLDRIDKKIQ